MYKTPNPSSALPVAWRVAAAALDEVNMQYVCTRQIEQQLPCSLLVVTSHHIVLCCERRLRLINFEGVQEREWMLESVIRYIKVHHDLVGVVATTTPTCTVLLHSVNQHVRGMARSVNPPYHLDERISYSSGRGRTAASRRSVGWFEEWSGRQGLPGQSFSNTIGTAWSHGEHEFPPP